MYRCQTIIFLVFFIFTSSLVSAAVHEPVWTELNKPVLTGSEQEPAVVEFFSFYCPPCHAFSQRYNIDRGIRDSLPKGKVMVKYHISTLGSQGEALTRAWSVAMVLGIEEKMEPLLFEAVQVTRTVKSPEDIRAVFVRAGVPAEQYEQLLASEAVREKTAMQARLRQAFGVTGTPSVFINGKYRINNEAFQAHTVADLRMKYVSAVTQLLNGRG